MYNLKREIREVLDKDLFLAYHEAKGHCLTEHLLTDGELKNKLWNMRKPKYEDDIVIATRFYSEETALRDIHTALLENIDKIQEWRNNLDYPYLEIVHDFPHPIGDGFCKNIPNIPVHIRGIRIILIANDKEGRAFYIKTAYPCTTLDDVDMIYDQMDANIA